MKQGSKKAIEAHQVALAAAAIAFDLCWVNGEPAIQSNKSWPVFSSFLHEDDHGTPNKGILDAEQIYFQAFAIEKTLEDVEAKTKDLTMVMFKAWDYYLRTLPSIHGIVFDYEVWAKRRSKYADAWDDLCQKLDNNPEIPRNPFYQLAMFLFQEMCNLSQWDQGPMLVGLVTMEIVASFTKTAQEWIIVSE